MCLSRKEFQIFLLVRYGLEGRIAGITKLREKVKDECINIANHDFESVGIRISVCVSKNVGNGSDIGAFL